MQNAHMGRAFLKKYIWNVTKLINFRQNSCILEKNAVQYMLYGKAFQKESRNQQNHIYNGGLFQWQT